MMYTNIPGRVRIELPEYYESFAWYYPDCEMQTKRWFVEHAHPEWVYMDCGAHIGYHSILFAQLSPNGWVHAIEPTATADMLDSNLRYNHCSNVTVHRLALGLNSGRQQENIFRIWGQPAEKMEYDFTTVDAFVAERNLARLDCLKIDVDSFDFEVLKGAEKTLKRFNPWILIELTDSLALRNSSPEEVLSWLETRGYASAVLLDQENFLLRRDAAALDAIPLAVLRWALEQGCLQVLKREILQLHATPPWACSNYAARAMEAAACDPSFVQLLQGLASEPKTAEVGQ
jgi:FkbM family methyltransferase